MLDQIKLWHERARPKPDQRAINAQLGAHLEEVCEMLETITIQHPDGTTIPFTATNAYASLLWASKDLKAQMVNVICHDRKGLCDALADQVVTAVGVGHTLGIDVPGAAGRVNASNWSKFVDGQPVFDENGKIAKGPNYQPVDLEGLF